METPVKKFIYEKIDILIAAGGTTFTKQQTFREGICKGAKIIHISSATAVAQAVNVSLKVNGDSVIEATDFRDFIPLGGGYVEGFKPCNFKSNLLTTLDVLATSAIATADFKAQMVFMIEVDCKS